MKLGEGGEAFFIFETTDDIPAALQTSPLVSPTTSPKPTDGAGLDHSSLQEPDDLDLDRSNATVAKNYSKSLSGIPIGPSDLGISKDLGMVSRACSLHCACSLTM
jgi:phosphatidate phosphatase LPIN